MLGVLRPERGGAPPPDPRLRGRELWGGVSWGGGFGVDVVGVDGLLVAGVRRRRRIQRSPAFLRRSTSGGDDVPVDPELKCRAGIGTTKFSYLP